MRTRGSNKGKTEPPFVVIKGRQERAVYRQQHIPEYQGNPLIEALPDIWTREEVEELLTYFPHFSKAMREWSAHERLHLLDNAREFFLPQAIHLDLEVRISCMLRRGLVGRNPLAWGYWNNFNKQIESIQPNYPRQHFLQCKARGFAIVGTGGVGKTSAVLNALSLYPQVIWHDQYKDRSFILKQLVWLYLTIPHDGSIKQFCSNFFATVDDILETSYSSRYTSRHTTTDEMLINMARVSSLHCLGVLVVDDIQNLSEAKSGGSAKILNFFVQLEDTIHVPFILIGTSKARPVLTSEFRHARRATEQGDINWERMKEIAENSGGEAEPKAGAVWEEYVRSLFSYQYVKKPYRLKDNLLKDPLARALYDVSQGITAVAGTVYLLAQRRAITTGLEQLSVSLIRSVAEDNQTLIAPMLEQIKLYNGSTSSEAIDVDSMDALNSLIKRGKITIASDLPNLQDSTSSTNTSPAKNKSTQVTNSGSGLPPKGTAGQSSVKGATKPAKRKKAKSPIPSQQPSYPQGDLRSLSPDDLAKLHPDQVAEELGSIKPATEFLQKEKKK